MSPQLRPVQQLVRGHETADGDGVRLTRLIGGPALPQLDPFLLLDDFRSDDPDDYIGGFPPHPHRGFETVTYLMHGRMRHGDNAGHSGVIEHGGVQWMTAGRGIVHSEMPEQENGLLAGFQLWVNLPAAHKMMAPRYQEFAAQAIPQEQREGGVVARVVAGTTSGCITGPVRELITPVSYFDITLPAGTRFEEPVAAERNAFVYVFEGSVRIAGRSVESFSLALLGDGDAVQIDADEHSRLLLVSGEPLHEPIARGGPFVMNTEAEVHQAYSDYRTGRF